MLLIAISAALLLRAQPWSNVATIGFVTASTTSASVYYDHEQCPIHAHELRSTRLCFRAPPCYPLLIVAAWKPYIKRNPIISKPAIVMHKQQITSQISPACWHGYGFCHANSVSPKIRLKSS